MSDSFVYFPLQEPLENAPFSPDFFEILSNPVYKDPLKKIWYWILVETHCQVAKECLLRVSKTFC